MTIYIIGVSGSGKTTVGKAIAANLGYPFLDADDFHTPQNIAKMHSGIPLTDADRLPWLQSINLAAQKYPNVVIACSALKQTYRDILATNLANVVWVYLQASEQLLLQRMQHRQSFMPPSLLSSQLKTWEVPQHCIVIDASLTVEEIVGEIVKHYR